MGVKATDFGSILLQQYAGFKGEIKFPDYFFPTKQVGAGTFGRNQDDNFGYSVAISGELAAVGVPYQDYDETGANSVPEAGAVYIYRRTMNSWEFAYKIAAPANDRANSDNFGYSVALNGSTLVVGAPKNALNALQTNPVIRAGAAFIYDITTTTATLEAKVVPQVRDMDDNFGFSVNVSDGHVFVGSHLHGRDESNSNSSEFRKDEAGAVWAYQKNTDGVWVNVKKLVAGTNEKNAGDNFGYALSAHENLLLVGVPFFDYVINGSNRKPNAGAVYVFDWKTDHWQYRTRLVAPDREEDDNFGHAVTIYGKKVAIGAPGKNSGSGKVYFYELSDLGAFVLVNSLQPTLPTLPVEYTQPTDVTLTDNAAFGYALSINQTHLVVGAPGQKVLRLSQIDTAQTPYTWSSNSTDNGGYAYAYEIGETNSLNQLNMFNSWDRFGNFTSTREDGRFGSSVSIGTNILIVGEPEADQNSVGTDNRSNAGLAHIYEFVDNSWTFSKTLEGFYQDRNAQDLFASKMVENGRFMVFTAPGQDFDSKNENYISNAGAAYVWEKVNNVWIYRQKLTASDRGVDKVFGSNVVIADNRIIVSSEETNQSGSAYVFVLESGRFVETQKIQPNDLVANNKFGSVMSASADRLFVSAINQNVPGSSGHGSVYSYVFDSVTNQYSFESKIIPTTVLSSNSLFGSSLQFKDDLLIVGAPQNPLDSSDRLSQPNAGAVYVFARINSAWVQQTKISAPGSVREAEDTMGYAVASWGNYLAVGVPGHNYDSAQGAYLDNAGSVRIYVRENDQWRLDRVVDSPNREENGRFGFSLAIHNQTLVVGAPGERNGGDAFGWGRGRAYAFVREFGQWVPKATFENAESGNQAKRLGWSVGVFENKIIVGETHNQVTPENATVVAGAGAAWIYEEINNVWTNVAKLTAQSLGGRTAGQNFGFSVDIKDRLAIVGSPFDNKNDIGTDELINAGSAYVYRRNETQEGVISWDPEKKFAGWPQDRNPTDNFGTAIAAYGNYIAVGSPNHDLDINQENPVSNAGAVYVYEWVGGQLVYKQKLVTHSATDRRIDTKFGTSLAMNGTHLVVGAPNWRDDQGSVRGKVWTFKLDNGVWVNESTFISTTPSFVNSGFGSVVSVDFLVMAIGAPNVNLAVEGGTSAIDGGAVEVYRYKVDRWELEQVLFASERENYDYFGQSITMRDNLIVVGGEARTNSTPGLNGDGKFQTGGAAWVFTYNFPTWGLVNKIVRGESVYDTDQLFGYSVSVDGDTLVVGMPNYDYRQDPTEYVRNAGAILVFKNTKNGWQYSQTLAAPTRVQDALFGSSVVVKDDVIWVGAPSERITRNSINYSAVGAVYGFRKIPTDITTRSVRKLVKFDATGANQSFTVPADVEQIRFYMWGAGGGTNGGNGGFTFVDVDVEAGEQFDIIVGRAPTTGNGGGGRSEIIRDGSTLAVAAGGGGGTNMGVTNALAGSGGGLIGNDGNIGSSLVLPGLGGSQTSGGPARTGSNLIAGSAGAFKQGGNGPTGDPSATISLGGWPNGGNGTTLSGVYEIPGGGDGWYGGSAGAVANSGNSIGTVGGGGSSYIAPGLNGVTKSVKTEYEDVATTLMAFTERPGGAGKNGVIVVEWFETYSHNEWEFEARLEPSAAISSSYLFGTRLAFDGASLVVSAPGNRTGLASTQSGVGIAYVYEQFGLDWTETARLYAFGEGMEGNYAFGHSLSVFEDFIFVGSPNQYLDPASQNSIINAGLVFAYKKVDGVWTNWQIIGARGSARESGDLLGTSIDYYSDWIAVGAPSHSFAGVGTGFTNDAGAVFLWKWQAGEVVFKQKLTMPSNQRVENALFGQVVRFSGDNLVVSAPGKTLTYADAIASAAVGKVASFKLENDEWVFQETLPLPATELNGNFGYDLAVSGSKIAVSSPLAPASAVLLDTSTYLTVKPKPLTYSLNRANAWSIEFDIKNTQISTSSYPIFSTLNWLTGTAGFHIDISSGSTTKRLRFIEENNGQTVMFDQTYAVADLNRGWFNIVLSHSASGVLTCYVNGQFAFTYNLGSNSPFYDIQNGFAFVGPPTANSLYAHLVDYIRINNQALTITTNQTEVFGTRTSTIGFAKLENSLQDSLNNFDLAIESAVLKSKIFGFSGGRITNLSSVGGKVHIFDRNVNSWTYRQSVAPAEQLSDFEDNFGAKLDLVDDFLIVSSPKHGYDQNGRNQQIGAGAAWFFQEENNVFVEKQKIVAWGHDLVAGEGAGTSIAAADTIIAVGSPDHPYDAQGNNYLVGAGAVYVWRRENDTWVIEQKIVAPNRVANAKFGSSVALSETRLVVGAPSAVNFATNTGQAFVFEKTSGATGLNPWSTGVELIPTGTNSRNVLDLFGHSVSLNGEDEIIIGAPYHDFNADGFTNLSNAGAVYVFRKTTDWAFAQKIVAGNIDDGRIVTGGRNAGDNFGWSVSARGNDLVVGAPYKKTDSDNLNSISDAGMVFVFEKADSTSDYQQVLMATSKTSSPASNDRNGSAVSGWGDYLAISSILHPYDENGRNYLNNAGAVFVLKNTGSGWEFIQKIVAQTSGSVGRNANANFGRSIKMYQDTLIVGAPLTVSSGVSNRGAVFVYRRTGDDFNFVQAFHPALAPSNNGIQFGSAVDFDGTTLIVGAELERRNLDAAQVGSAYFYTLNESNLFVQNSRVIDEINAYASGVGFGYSVSVKDNLAVFGANGSNNSTGYAVVAQKVGQTWQYVDTIRAQRPVADSNLKFGSSIAFSDTEMFVGAPRDSYDQLYRPLSNSGTVYVFENVEGTWTFKQRLAPFSFPRTTSENFGTGLHYDAASGELAVGAPGYRYNNGNTLQSTTRGAVFIFKKQADGYYYTSERITPDEVYGNNGMGFGETINREGNVLVVGAPTDRAGETIQDINNTSVGAIVIYKKFDDTWFYVAKHAPKGEGSTLREGGMEFGRNVSINDGFIAVGVPATRYDIYGDLIKPSNTGKVFTYQLESLDNLRISLVGGNYSSIAKATPTFNPTTGAFTGVNITARGAGYKQHPTVEFSADGFAGYALLEPTGVNSAKLTSIGTNSNPTVNVVRDPLDTTGSGAQVSLVRGSSFLASVTITDNGSGYTDAPTVTASSGSNVSLRAYLQPTTVGLLSLQNGGTNLTSFPTLSIGAPGAGGTQATGRAIITLESVLINDNAKSYVGEEFTLDSDAIIQGRVKVTSVDASSMITGIELLNPGEYSALATFLDIPAIRVIEKESYGSILDDDVMSINEDYGAVDDAVTETEDFGFVGDPVTESEDYQTMVSGGTISYGSINESVTETMSFGPITNDAISVDVRAKVKRLELTNPGAGYESKPIVSFSGGNASSIQAQALIIPTGVGRVEVLSGGLNVAANTTISFSGANTTPATATAVVEPGLFTGLRVDNPGTGYTRTPTIVFSDPGFTGTVSLSSTRLDTIVVTQSDNTLTVTGRTKLLKVLDVPETGRSTTDTYLGYRIAGRDDTLIATANRANNSISGTDNRSLANYVSTFELKAKEDKINKIKVDGWMNGAAAMQGVSGDFAISIWFKSTPVQKAQNLGSMFALTKNGENTHYLLAKNDGMILAKNVSNETILGFASEFDDEWHNIVYSLNGTLAEVYLDGVFVGSTTANALTSGTSLVVGACLANDGEPTLNEFNGFMADIVVWNTSLDQTDVDAIIEGQIPKSASTKAIWAQN